MTRKRAESKLYYKIQSIIKTKYLFFDVETSQCSTTINVVFHLSGFSKLPIYRLTSI